MKPTTELFHQLKSAAQEEIMCREASDTSDAWQDLASPENILALIEIALPVLEQQESPTDTYRQIENDGWIGWKGGRCPVQDGVLVQVMMRNGEVDGPARKSESFTWFNGGRNDVDIIAYRVIESDGREG